jgi:hypothetical protein
VPDIDVPLFFRLREAVRGAIAAVPQGQAAESGRALQESYERLRPEILRAIPDHLADEFNRLFPEQEFPRLPRHNLVLVAAQSNEARAALGAIAGWLDGLVQAADHENRLRLEAEAYARERVQSERGIGFRPS